MDWLWWPVSNSYTLKLLLFYVVENQCASFLEEWPPNGQVKLVNFEINHKPNLHSWMGFGKIHIHVYL